MFWLHKYLTTKLNFSTSIGIFSVFLMLFSLSIFINLSSQKEDFSKSEVVRATGEHASLTLSAEPTQEVEKAFEALIILNTDSRPIKQVDVVIDYDPDTLQLVDIIPIAKITTSFKTFSPTYTDGSFAKEKVIAQSEKTRQIIFSARASEPFNGATQLAILRFKPVMVGATAVSFFFWPSSTSDTNILAAPDGAFDLLTQSSQLVNASINILSPSPTQKLTP